MATTTRTTEALSPIKVVTRGIIPGTVDFPDKGVFTPHTVEGHLKGFIDMGYRLFSVESLGMQPGSEYGMDAGVVVLVLVFILVYTGNL